MCSQHEGLLSETRKAIGTVALRVRPEHEPLELEVSLRRRGSREPQTQVLALLIPDAGLGWGQSGTVPPWQDAGLGWGQSSTVPPVAGCRPVS